MEPYFKKVEIKGQMEGKKASAGSNGDLPVPGAWQRPSTSPRPVQRAVLFLVFMPKVLS